MATTNNTTTRKDFDFDAYNAVMKGANAGLKLFLASQLLGDVATTAFRYRNPLAQALMDTTEELEQFRKDWKAIAEKSMKQTQAKEAVVQADTPVFDANQFQPAIY
mgnify:CR=1 FL=1